MVKTKQKKLAPFSNLIMQFLGVYEIFNSFHDRYYIGYSTDLSVRVRQHPNDLNNHGHSNKAMENDYHEIKKQKKNPWDFFSVKILAKEFLEFDLPRIDIKALKKKWRQTEKDYIEEYSQKGFSLYNKMRKKGNQIVNLDYEYYKNLPAPGTSVLVVADGLQFKTIKHAMDCLGETREFIKKQIRKEEELINEEELEEEDRLWYYPKEEKPFFEKPAKPSRTGNKKTLPIYIRVGDKVFGSARETGDANDEVSKETVMSRCSNTFNPDFKDWKFIPDDEMEQVEEYFRSSKTLPKKVVQKNSSGKVIATFNNITEAANKTGINRSLVSMAANDINNKEWDFA